MEDKETLDETEDMETLDGRQMETQDTRRRTRRHMMEDKETRDGGHGDIRWRIMRQGFTRPQGVGGQGICI